MTGNNTFRESPSKLILSNSTQCKELIEKWMENENWTFNDFADLLRQININLPITLEKIYQSGRKGDEKIYTIYAKTSDNSSLLISPEFGLDNIRSSTLSISNSDGANCYVLPHKSDRIHQPILYLKNRTILKTEKYYTKNLYSVFSEPGYYYYSLSFGVTEFYPAELTISFRTSRNESPKTYSDFKEKFKIIENYLLELDEQDARQAMKIYQKLIDLLELTEEEIQTSFNLNVSYDTPIKNPSAFNHCRVLSGVFFENGKLVKLATLDQDLQSFVVRENGNWEFKNGITNLKYEKKTNIYSITACSKNEFPEINTRQLVKNVKKEILKLQEKLLKYNTGKNENLLIN